MKHNLSIYALVALGILTSILACNFQPPENTPTPLTEVPLETIVPVPTDPVPVTPTETVADNYLVTYSADSFHIRQADGTLIESRPAPGLQSWASPNTFQIVNDNIYYVDSNGSGLTGMVKVVSSIGITDLPFTSTIDLAKLTFCISPDETKIAWANAKWADSQLYVANIDGTDVQLITQSDPADTFEDHFVLETVSWISDHELVYSWQISGIGNLLFFGYSSFYGYDISSASLFDIAPLIPSSGMPCWSSIDQAGTQALGSCEGSSGSPGMRLRDLTSAAETIFPLLPGQQQSGAGSFAPDSDRLAFGIGEWQGNEAIIGAVAVRMNNIDDPFVLAAAPEGYFHRTVWLNADRLYAGGSESDIEKVYEVTMAGVVVYVTDGELIGIMIGH